MTRTHLLLTTALVLLAPRAGAQAPAPNQLPTGMRVIAGQATGTTSGTTLQVSQGSSRAAIDWSSFNIGANATVRFHDPSAQAMTLNRVSGPGASMIAGHLASNGQMVLINQSGVVFMPGSVVDAQSVVVSAAGITEAGMRRGVATGRFVLDQPAHPGARIENSGRISVRHAGLAALVAPQVANHGTINAAFGTVSLLGVTSHVVDLYGDGLLSIDVSRQTVRGAGGEAALVTNDGLIAARSGQVTLSTDAVEGVVDNLVEAGGTISTDGTGRQGGRVLIDAQGGTADVTGTLTALGLGRSSIGGHIAIRASEAVNLTATALVDASGTAGGGVVAIGTTLARAQGGVGVVAPAARLVGIAPGARVAADALVSGRGGQVTVLSTDNTVTYGSLSAHGGALSGDAGHVEVSGTLGLSLFGSVDLTAAHGRAGSLTIDPGNLVVQTVSGGASLNASGTLSVGSGASDATIDPSVLNAASGTVTLIANDNLDVMAGFSLNSTGLTLTATLGTITVGGTILNIGGGIVMNAGSDIFLNAQIVAVGDVSISAGGVLTQAAGAPIFSSRGSITLAAAGLMTLGDVVAARTSINLVQAHGVTQTGGSLSAPSLVSSLGAGLGGNLSGNVALARSNNAITALGTFTVSGGGFTLNDSVPTLTVSQSVSVTGGGVTLHNFAGALTLAAGLTASGGINLLAAGALTQQSGAPIDSTGAFVALTSGGAIGLGDNITTSSDPASGSLNILAATSVSQTGGSITTPGVFSSGGAGITGSVTLTSTTNAIGELGPLAVTSGDLFVDTAGSLIVGGSLSAGDDITLASGQDMTVAASITANGALNLLAGTASASGALTQNAGAALISTHDAMVLEATGTITLGDLVSATDATNGSLSFVDAAAVVQSGGSITTPTVFGGPSFGGSVSLTQTANSIGAVGAFSAVGGFTLVTSVPTLTTAGAVTNTNGDLLLRNTGAITLTQAITTLGHGAITLDAGGNLTVGGNVEAAVAPFRGTSSASGVVALLSGGTIAVNAVVLATAVSGGAAPLVSLTAPAVTIRTGTLGLGGFLLAQSGTVELAPPSGVAALGTTAAAGFFLSQAELGQIATTTLRIGATGHGGAADGIGVDGGFDVTAISPFTGVATAATLDLEAGAGGISISGGPLRAGTLLVGTSGTVAQVPGVAGAVVDAATLAGIGTLGGVALANTLNAIGTLASIATGSGPISVATAGTLALVGPISTSGSLTLHAGGSISLSGALSAGTLSLTTTGGTGVVWATGFSAGTITGNVAGDVSLSDTNSGTTTLNAFAASGNLSLATGGPLTTAGAVTGADVTLSATGLLDIASAVSGLTIDLGATSVAEDSALGSLNGTAADGGFLGVLTSIGTIGGDVSLLGQNTLTEMQGFAASGTLTLLNTQSMTIESGVAVASAAFRVTHGGSIEIDQPLVIPATGTLSLRADNLVVGGGATFDVVNNVAGGTIALIAVAPDSTETMLLGGAAVSSAGTLAISNANFLLGALRATTLQVGGLPDGSLTAANIVVQGASFAPGVTLLLDTAATGGVTQTAALTADVLGGNIGGSGLVLTNAGNAVNQVTTLAVAGSASLVDAAPTLTVSGAFGASGSGTLAIAVDHFRFSTGSLSAGTVAIGPRTAGHTLALADTTGSFDIELGDLSRITATTLEAGNSFLPGTAVALQTVLNGNVNLPGDTLVLDAGAGGVTQSAGTLSVGLLAGASGGGFAFTDGADGNTIGALGAISAQSIGIADQTALQVQGLVASSGGPLSLSAPSITVTASGSVSAAGGTLGLTTDSLTGAAGQVSNAGGLVAVSPFSNAVLTVGPAAGHVDLSVITAATIELFSSSFGIAFSGNVAPGAPILLLQASNAPVTEGAADSLTVGTLEGFAGSLSLAGTANAIGTLDRFSVGLGNLSIVDSGLVVAGAISATNPSAAQTITLQGGSLTLDPGTSFTTAATAPAGALVLQADTLAGTLDATVPGGTVLLERLTAGAQTSPQIGSLTAGTLQLGGIIGASPSATALTLATLNSIHVGTLLLVTSGAVTQTGSVVLASGTLGGQAGSVTLESGGNTIGVLGGFTAGAGDFTLVDAGALKVIGAVTASGHTLTLTDTAAIATAGISLAPGSALNAGTVVLNTGAGNLGVAQDAASRIVGTLAGSIAAGNALLLGTANAIGAITTLGVAGLLELADSIGLTETASGIVSAGTLGLGGAADIRLDGTANAIGTLGAITVLGTFALSDGDPVLDGPVTAGLIAFSVDGIGYVAGSLTATGVVAPGFRPLFASAGTVEIGPRGPGVLNLGTAAAGQPFVSAGLLAHIDAAVLQLGTSADGPLASGIAVNAPVAISSALPAAEQVATVDLLASGGVTEVFGATFGVPFTLIGNTGAVSLNGGANAVPVLGAYDTNGGSFALADAGALAVEGDVVASGITLVVAGALSLDAGSLLAPGGTVDLTAAGASEGAGIIDAATLDSSGTPSGAFLLTGANLVGTLGTWNAPGGTLSLTDATGAGAPSVLSVAGPVSVATLTLQAEALAFTGNATVSGTATLATSVGGVSQSGGTLSAGLLTSPGVAGDVVLTEAGNAVTALGPFAAAGHAFSLTDGVSLGVAGTLTAASVLLTDPVSLAVAAPVIAPLIQVRGGTLAIGAGGVLLASGGTVDIVASGASESGGGVIDAATLLSGGTPSGAFVLGGANSIDTLGSFQMAAGGTLLLADTTGLTLTGAVAADAVDLSTTRGGIAETTGSIATNLLSSSFGVAGGETLENAGNAVAALGGIAVTGGDFRFAQPGSLGVAGTVAAPDVTIRIGGALAIAGTGTLQAGGTVDLSASGATEAASGAIVAPVLTSSAGASGAFGLYGANQIGTLGLFGDSAGALALNDLQKLVVAGPVGVAFLGLQAPSITLAGTITAGQMQVATSAGGLLQTGGVLTATALYAPDGIAGDVSLGAANTIALLGAFSATGTIAITDATELVLIGAVATPSGVTLSLGGALAEAPGGSLAAATLSGNAAAVDLTQTANAIGTLSFATAGSLALADQQSLTVTALSGLGASLDVAGDLTLAGNVSEPGSLLSLTASGAVTQTGGSISAGQLGGAAASFALPGANAVAALTDIAAPGGFTLNDTGPLLITGAVRGGLVDLSVAAGGILEQGGGLLAGQLRSSSGIVGDTILGGANQLTAIGPLTDRGNLLVANTEALTAGNIVASALDLSTTAGGIDQDGPISAALLTSSFGIAGGARFDDAGNSIGTLGRMQVSGGDLTLIDATSLTVAGPVGADNIALGVAGSVSQTGDIATPGTFATNSAGQYQRTAGALSVGTLTGSAGGVADFGTAAAVLSLGAFSVHDNGDAGYPAAAPFSTLSIADGSALSLAGPLSADYIAITATGTLLWSGDISTLGLLRPSQQGSAPSNPGSYLAVVAGPGGTAQILQTGVVHVSSQDAGLSTLRLQLPPTGGSIVLADLEAPSTDLLLFIGAGHASGRINVGNLLVSGQQGGASLVGSVNNLVGYGAARASDLAPVLSANYRINSCPLHAVNCVLLPTETVPQQNPLRDLAIGQARDALDDTDVLLPNVAEQDY